MSKHSKREKGDMATAAASKRNWAELPTDVLISISQCLWVIEYIRFRAVCTSWALALPKKQPLRFPWVMLAGKDDELNNTNSFFSLIDDKFYSVASLHQRRGKWWVGSAEGWVVTLDGECKMRLLNPLVRAEIQLPSITTFPDTKVVPKGEQTNYLVQVFFNCPWNWWPLDSFGRDYIYKVILSIGPSSTAATTATTSNTSAVHGGYTAVAITRNSRLAYTRAGDDQWTIFDANQFTQDAIFHKGLFYTLSCYGGVRAWDLRGLSSKMTIISKGIKGWTDSQVVARKYLVESSGDILQVWRHLSYSSRDCKNGRNLTVKVFKFDSSEDKWIRVTSLGDRSLFLGLNHSMSLCARDIPGLTGNCIYFSQDNWPLFKCRPHYSDLHCDLGVFNLEDGSFKPYYLNNSNLNNSKETSPGPIWFMPSLL